MQYPLPVRSTSKYTNLGSFTSGLCSRFKMTPWANWSQITTTMSAGSKEGEISKEGVVFSFVFIPGRNWGDERRAMTWTSALPSPRAVDKERKKKKKRNWKYSRLHMTTVVYSACIPQIYLTCKCVSLWCKPGDGFLIWWRCVCSPACQSSPCTVCHGSEYEFAVHMVYMQI